MSEVIIGLFIGSLVFFFVYIRPRIIRKNKYDEWHKQNVEKSLVSISYSKFFEHNSSKIVLPPTPNYAPGTPFISEAWAICEQQQDVFLVSVLFRVSDAHMDFMMAQGVEISRDGAPLYLSNGFFGYMTANLYCDSRTADSSIIFLCEFRDSVGNISKGTLDLNFSTGKHSFAHDIN